MATIDPNSFTTYPMICTASFKMLSSKNPLIQNISITVLKSIYDVIFEQLNKEIFISISNPVFKICYDQLQSLYNLLKSNKNVITVSDFLFTLINDYGEVLDKYSIIRKTFIVLLVSALISYLYKFKDNFSYVLHLMNLRSDEYKSEFQ